MELQSKPRSREIRRRALEALGTGAYWPYVGGNFVLNAITAVVMVVPLLAVAVVGFLIFKAIGDAPGRFGLEQLAGIPPELFVALAAAMVVLTVAWTYAIGFASWGGGAMALAAADRRFGFGICLSGYGHGWKMAWTVMVEWTYVSLWGLVLIVPGVMKAFSYAMTKYVQVEHPDWSADRCIEESMRLMRGNRRRLLKLGLSFVGWIALVALAAPFGLAGLAQIFLMPYPMTAFAAFYRQLLVEKGPPLP